MAIRRRLPAPLDGDTMKVRLVSSCYVEQLRRALPFAAFLTLHSAMPSYDAKAEDKN